HYVLFRFIAPWFESELQGVDGHQRNARIQQLAVLRFGTPGSPPYLIESREGIQLIRFEPGWHAWLRENVVVLPAFADRVLILFLQARDPSVPAIPAKLRAPLYRNLRRARIFWTTAFPALVAGGVGAAIHDIYSGEELQSDFALDHFLPWTFVAHDLLWNL